MYQGVKSIGVALVVGTHFFLSSSVEQTVMAVLPSNNSVLASCAGNNALRRGVRPRYVHTGRAA